MHKKLSLCGFSHEDKNVFLFNKKTSTEYPIQSNSQKTVEPSKHILVLNYFLNNRGYTFQRKKGSLVSALKLLLRRPYLQHMLSCFFYQNCLKSLQHLRHVAMIFPKCVKFLHFTFSVMSQIPNPPKSWQHWPGVVEISASFGYKTWLHVPGVVKIPSQNHHQSDQFQTQNMTPTGKDSQNKIFKTVQLPELIFNHLGGAGE